MNDMIIPEVKEKMNKSIESYEQRLKTVRAGRANPSSLDGVSVDYYGTMTPLKQLATISVPEATQLLIKPFDTNPFQEVKIEGGIITDLGGMTPEYKSNETGEIEQEQQFIKVGTVIETGYECKFVKPGDVVFYTIASENMIPFFRQGFVTVAENRIMAIVNENLTERKENYGRKSVF